MLNRVSINALLKSVILVLCTSLVIILALGAWESWQKVHAANRIAAVAEASTHIFKALHNLRSDRARTYRVLMAEKSTASDERTLQESRVAEVPALKAALATLQTMSFPNQAAVMSELEQRTNTLTRLHAESLAALQRPKAERPSALAKTAVDEMTGLISFLDRLTIQLNRLVKLEDSFVDQLLELKQLAWIARDRGGDASVIISNTMAGQPLAADAFTTFTANLAKADMAWGVLQEMAAGLPMPASFNSAVEVAKREFFGRDYTELRTRTLKELISGQKPSITFEQWSPMSTPKLATVLTVAEAALDVAKDHAANQRSAAMRSLVVQLGLLVLALGLAAGMILVVTRRVTRPLVTIQQAMLKLAGGDFNVVLPGLDRKDEIGAMANAVERFKVLAIEK
ncbi:MAG TPA: HAMP domain-containing protein, partial [Xanthobacteraceae bacterium]|nr:HAMP domain-containing protein [Xanthobacteraceae bacterium]